MSQETSAKASPDFLNPASMLTPGIAGAMTMMIANSLGGLLFSEHGPLAAPTVAAFINNMGFLALAISFLFGLLVLVAGSVPFWQRLIYYLINSLIIFSVAIGTNEVGGMAERAEHAGRSERDGGESGSYRDRDVVERLAADQPSIILARAGSTSSWPEQLAQASSTTTGYSQTCQKALRGQRDKNGYILVKPQSAQSCFSALQSLEKEIYQAAQGGSRNCTAQLSACNAKVGALDAELRAVEQKAKNHYANWQDAEARWQACERGIAPLRQDAENARRDLRQCNRIVNDLRQQIAGAGGGLEQCKQTVASLKQQLDAARKEAKTAQQAATRAQQELERTRVELAAARAAAESGTASQAAVDKARRAAAAARQDAKTAQAAADKAEQRATQFEGRLSDAQNQLKAAQKREHDLQRRLDAAIKSAGKSGSENEVVAALERELAATRKAVEEHQDRIAAMKRQVAAAEQAAADARAQAQTGQRPIKGRFFKPWSLF